MDKATIVKSALKNVKGKTQNVKVVNRPEVTIASKPYKPTPTLNLTSTDLPDIKNWKVGTKYRLSLEVQQTSLSQGNDYEIVDRPDTATRATFKVLSVKADK